MIRRHYNGPARISGTAGTGKSVVALHRMVRLARRSVGKRDDTVKVGTVYRSKGLEFRAVVVPELRAHDSGGESGRESREREQRAQLVALTRARDHLWLGQPES